MANDVFSRSVRFGGTFSADGTRVTFGGGAASFGCGMIVQQINFQYQQNISRLYEVGCPDIYLVAGRTQGQAGLNRVLGPKRLSLAFYKQFGDVCSAGANTIKFAGRVGCNEANLTRVHTVQMNNCVLSNIGGTINSQDMLFNESLGMMFLSLQLRE